MSEGLEAVMNFTHERAMSLCSSYRYEALEVDVGATDIGISVRALRF